MGKIDPDAAPRTADSAYPAPFDVPCRGRLRLALGEAAGLTQFGVNMLRLPPGRWSSQRHWHTEEDEFVWVLAGEVVLVTGAGEQLLRAGDCAGFPAGAPDGHHIQNRSGEEALLLEVGSRRPATDCVDYPDIDLRWSAASGDTRKDGTPYWAARPLAIEDTLATPELGIEIPVAAFYEDVEFPAIDPPT